MKKTKKIMIEESCWVCPMCSGDTLEIHDGINVKCSKPDCTYETEVFDLIAYYHDVSVERAAQFIGEYIDCIQENSESDNPFKNMSVVGLLQCDIVFFYSILNMYRDRIDEFCLYHAERSGLDELVIRASLCGMFEKVSIEEWLGSVFYFLDADTKGLLGIDEGKEVPNEVTLSSQPSGSCCGMLA